MPGDASDDAFDIDYASACAPTGLPRFALWTLAVLALALPVLTAAVLPGEERVLVLSVLLLLVGGFGLLIHLAVYVLRAAGIRLLGIYLGPVVVRWDNTLHDHVVL